MLKPILSSLILLAGLQAHAERLPAIQFGLTPETGYLEAVTEDENCNPATDVLLKKQNDDPMFITKCDGSLIGWITRNVSPEQLSDDAKSSDRYDLEIKTGSVYDRFGNDAINIYVCGKSRKDELDQHPEIRPAKLRRKTYNKLKRISGQGRSLSVQLFFNEFVYSGKCIGELHDATDSASALAF